MTDSTSDIRRNTSAETEFDQGFTLGYANGYEVGYGRGMADESASWAGVIEPWRKAMAAPEHQRLAEIRAEADAGLTTPCTVKCQKCSRCIRYESWWRNGRKDFAGTDMGIPARSVAA